MRWQLEVTFQEVRAHLGVETQRQWLDWAGARATPALLGWLSLVTLLAHLSTHQGRLPVHQAAWYAKPLPAFSDALVAVRHQLWQAMSFHTSVRYVDMQRVPLLPTEAFHRCLVLCNLTAGSSSFAHQIGHFRPGSPNPA